MMNSKVKIEVNKKELKNESYKALYRKYRPTEFKEVIGQNLALQALENAIQNDKIAHSYIFYGDRGTGKTTTARIFARAIGSSPEDIIELDAASNRKIENMREVIEASRASTYGSKYKVYILDEAHMLTTEAANALLKTLEEPPAHVIFILATTNKQKLPNTIISRCQQIDFVSPSVSELVELISKVLSKEKIEIAEAGKKLIALAGHGSYRDTLGVLERIINTADKTEISLQDVETILGITSEERILKIIEAIGDKDVVSLIKIVSELKLETYDLVESLYLELVKIWEIALYMKFLNLDEAKKIFANKVTEKLIVETKELSQKYINEISASNLVKTLEIEKSLKENPNLAKEVLTTNLIKIIEG